MPAGVLGLAGMLFLVYLIVTEARRLERAAQRYRELEDEGIESIEREDSMPEFGRRRGTILMPDGTPADRDRVLRAELARLRRYQRESGGLGRPDQEPRG